MDVVNLPAGEYLSTTAAAAALGVTTGRIRQLIRAGSLKAYPVGARGHLIPVEDIQDRMPTKTADVLPTPVTGGYDPTTGDYSPAPSST